MENKFTEKEAALLIQLIDGASVKPRAPDSEEMCRLIHSIEKKVEANTEREGPQAAA